MGRLRLKRGVRRRLGAERSARRGGARALPPRRSRCRAGRPRVHIPWWALALAFARHRDRRGPRALPPQLAHRSRSASSRSSSACCSPRPATSCSAGWSARRSCSCFTPGRVPVRVVFNLAQLGGHRRRSRRAVFHAVDRRRRRGSARTCGSPPLLAVLLAVVVSVLLVSAAMWLSGDSVEPRKLGADGRHVDLRRGDQHEPRPRRRRRWSSTDPRARRSCCSRPCWPSSSPTAPTSRRAPPGRRTSSSCTRRAGRSRPPPTTPPASPGLLAMALETLPRRGRRGLPLPAEGEGDGQADLRRRPARRSRSCSRSTSTSCASCASSMERDAAARLVTPDEVGRRARRPPAASSASRARCSRRCPASAARSGRCMVADRAGLGGAFDRLGAQALRHARAPDRLRARPGPPDHQGRRAARAAGRSSSTRPSTTRSPGSPTACCSWTASTTCSSAAPATPP